MIAVLQRSRSVALSSACSSSLTQHASIAPQPSATRALSLFGPSATPQPPLDELLPGVPQGKAEPRPVAAVQVTALPNGVRVLSRDAGEANTTVSVFVGTGSRFETEDNAGVSAVLAQMGFRSTATRTQLRLVRDVEALGGRLNKSNGRDLLTYSATAPRADARGVFHAVAETTVAPTFRAWEVAEASQDAAEQAARASEDVATHLTELLHAAAFHDDSSLGRTQFLPSWSSGVSHEDAAAFRAAAFTAGNVVVSGTGIAHEELVKMAESYFAEVAAGGAQAVQASPYVGGEQRVRTSGSLAHVLVGVAAPGRKSADFAATQVLRVLVGGAGSSHVKYPGSGVLSRVGEHVTGKVQGVLRAQSFLNSYADTSLFGVYTLSTGAAAGDAVRSVAGVLAALAAAPPSAEEVARAKAQAKVALATGAFSAQVAATQLLDTGAVASVAQHLAAIDAVKPEDVARVAKAAFKVRPTVVSLGAVKGVPHVDALVKML